MTKNQRFAWAATFSILTLSVTFKPTSVYGIDTVSDFEGLVDYLTDPQTFLQTEWQNIDKKTLALFSLPMTMYLLGEQLYDDTSILLSDHSSNTISGTFNFNNNYYPAVFTAPANFTLSSLGEMKFYVSGIGSYSLKNNSTLPLDVTFTHSSPTPTTNGLLYFEWDGSLPVTAASSNPDVFTSRVSYSALRGRYVPTVPPFQNEARSYFTPNLSAYACLGFGTSEPLPSITFSRATLTDDWVNSAYPYLKSVYPDVDNYLPIVTTIPVPEYTDFVYPPDFPIPEMPTVELPTDDIPSSAVSGVSFWFTNFTNLLDSLNIKWFVILMIAFALFMHIILKF